QAVLPRFVSLYVAQDRLRPTATEADVVNEIVGAEIWRRAYTDGWQHGPAQAVARVRDRLKQEGKRLFQHRDLGGEALLPALADLLASAAGKDVSSVSDDHRPPSRPLLPPLAPP